MSNFDRIYDDIKRRKENIESGGINSIPFPLKNLNKAIPGIAPEIQIGLTSSSGGMKSKLSRALFLNGPYEYYQKHKDISNMDLKIFMFTLEDSPDRVRKYMLIKALYETYGIRVDVRKIDSYLEEDKLSDDLLFKIDTLRPYMEEMEKVVEFSNISNPTGILKKVKEYLLRKDIGCLIDEYGNELNSEQASDIIKRGGAINYKSTNTNRFVIVVIDNLQNVTPEQGLNKYDTLDLFTRKYCRNVLCNMYKCSTVLIQQQNQDTAKKQFTTYGDSIVDKLIPSEAGLGEFKNSVQTMHYLIGLFEPAKYGIEDFQTDAGLYNIRKLGGYYRYLNVIKSNFVSNVNLSLFADPIAETFTELPKATEKITMEQFYKKAEELEMNLNKEGLL